MAAALPHRCGALGLCVTQHWSLFVHKSSPTRLQKMCTQAMGAFCAAVAFQHMLGVSSAVPLANTRASAPGAGPAEAAPGAADDQASTAAGLTWLQEPLEEGELPQPGAAVRWALKPVRGMHERICVVTCCCRAWPRQAEQQCLAAFLCTSCSTNGLSSSGQPSTCLAIHPPPQCYDLLYMLC